MSPHSDVPKGDVKAPKQGLLGGVGRSWAFLSSLLVVPWPPFLGLLVVKSVLGGVAPVVQVIIIALLTDHIAGSLGPAGAGQLPASALPMRSLVPLMLLYLLAHILRWLVSADPLQRYCATHMQVRLRDRGDLRLLERAVSLPLGSFTDPQYYDQILLWRRTLETRNVVDKLTSLQIVAATLLACLGMLALLGWMRWSAAAILVASSVLTGLLSIPVLRDYVRINVQGIPAERKRDYWRDLAVQPVSNAEIRLFGLRSHVLRRWRQLADECCSVLRRMRHRNKRRLIPIYLVNVGALGLILFSLLRTMDARPLTPGVFVAVLFAIMIYSESLLVVTSQLGDLGQFFGDLLRLRSFVTARSEPVPTKTQPFPERLAEGIRFESVSFRYPGSPGWALEDVSVHIPAGSTVAIVGENGAGKTTFAKLLLGLYEPVGGCIRADGLDIRKIDAASWRDNVSAVFQDHVQYKFSVRENIGVGRIENVEDLPAITSVSKLCKVDDFVQALPHQYETVLGSGYAGGVELSRGQWARVAMARALYRNAQVVVFDEPTASLDALAESEIYQQVLDLCGARTLVFISHRLKVTHIVDLILVFDAGHLVQSGSHEELISQPGPYAELHRAQTYWYDDTTNVCEG